MREEFIKQIETVLQEYGFANSSTSERWEYTRVQEYTQPGQTVVINGQQMEVLGRVIPVKHIVFDMGDGYYENVDGSNRVEFVQLEIQLWVNSEFQDMFCSSYECGDIEAVKKDLMNILRL